VSDRVLRPIRRRGCGCTMPTRARSGSVRSLRRHSSTAASRMSLQRLLAAPMDL
jgi:hypothetical protein